MKIIFRKAHTDELNLDYFQLKEDNSKWANYYLRETFLYNRKIYSHRFTCDNVFSIYKSLAKINHGNCFSENYFRKRKNQIAEKHG